MIFFSIIIPVYNRPQELDELLFSLTKQEYTNFEVLVIEDGSSLKSDHLIEKYSSLLSLTYYFKPNTGQGFSRNFGFEHAKGDFFVVFDSDCLIPSHYFRTVNEHLLKLKLDAYGGPDRSHASFTPLQKAISYSMTSPFTTGGIRGNKKHMGDFHPRSFNMGISKQVFEKTGGYLITRMGEDIEFSIRIHAMGFTSGLIEDAFVYHKRRTNLEAFYRQLHFFGRARINVGRFYPSEIRFVHTLPAIFVVSIVCWILSFLFSRVLFFIGLLGIFFFFGGLLVDAWRKTKSVNVALLSVAAAFIQLSAYGIGFISEGFKRLFRS